MNAPEFAVTVQWVDDDDRRQTVRTHNLVAGTSQTSADVLREAVAISKWGSPSQADRVCLLNVVTRRTNEF